MSKKITYQLSLEQKNAHIFAVKMKIEGAQKNQSLSLPRWTPGSYMIREFAQHIISIKAFENGQEIKCDKINNNSWEISNTGECVELEYQVYGFDSSIRAAFIDNQQAFFNGTALFLRAETLENAQHELVINKPKESSFELATTMPAAEIDNAGFGEYFAASYEELVDYPVQISKMKRLKFTAAEIPHEVVLVGDIRDFDEQRLTKDLSKLCESQIKFFGQAPFKKYLFIARFEENNYGGLEHRNSSMLVVAPNTLPKVGLKEPDKNYRLFLGLCSHEYFHAWNIKSIKPKEFVPYDLNNETYTNMLWVFEGITSYYDDLFLVRAGLISEQSYLELLSENINKLNRNLGRLNQSLYDASFDAWIKFYRPHENSSNTNTSYYLKGSLLALYLDRFIASKTKGQKSLDDVVKSVYGKYGQERGVSNEQWLFEIEATTGCFVPDFEANYIRGLKEIPLREIFCENGVEYSEKDDDNFADDKTLLKAHIGFKIQFDDRQRGLISFVELNSPAMEAGLSFGDEIIAINGRRLEASNWSDLALFFEPGSVCEIIYSRKKQIFKTSLKPSNLLRRKCILKPISSTNDEKNFAQWIKK